MAVARISRSCTIVDFVKKIRKENLNSRETHTNFAITHWKKCATGEYGSWPCACKRARCGRAHPIPHLVRAVVFPRAPALPRTLHGLIRVVWGCAEVVSAHGLSTRAGRVKPRECRSCRRSSTSRPRESGSGSLEHARSCPRARPSPACENLS